MKMKSGTFFMS